MESRAIKGFNKITKVKIFKSDKKDDFVYWYKAQYKTLFGWRYFRPVHGSGPAMFPDVDSFNSLFRALLGERYEIVQPKEKWEHVRTK